MNIASLSPRRLHVKMWKKLTASLWFRWFPYEGGRHTHIDDFDIGLN